jgi:hypothetical protein
VIVYAAAGAIQRRGLISRFAEFEQFLTQHKTTLGERLRALLDEVETMEVNTGQRTPGMEDHAESRAVEIATNWSPRPQLEIVR